MPSAVIGNRDAINSAFQLLWRKLPAALELPGPFPLIYAVTDSAELPTIDPGNKPWGRLVVQIIDGKSTNIGQTRWRIRGMASLQIFTRRKVTKSMDTCQKAGKFFLENFIHITARDAIVYTNLRDVDMPADNGYSRVDFIANWYYDEFRQRPYLQSVQPPVNPVDDILFDDVPLMLTDDTDSPLTVGD